jgi:hypothetical protein
MAIKTHGVFLTNYQSTSLMKPLIVDHRVVPSQLTIDFQGKIIEILQEIVRFVPFGCTLIRVITCESGL